MGRHPWNLPERPNSRALAWICSKLVISCLTALPVMPRPAYRRLSLKSEGQAETEKTIVVDARLNLESRFAARVAAACWLTRGPSASLDHSRHCLVCHLPVIKSQCAFKD